MTPKTAADWRSRCALVIAMFATIIAGARTPVAGPFRPQYHLSAARNGINDPNGLLVLDGEYHLSTSTTRSAIAGDT